MRNIYDQEGVRVDVDEEAIYISVEGIKRLECTRDEFNAIIVAYSETVE